MAEESFKVEYRRICCYNDVISGPFYLSIGADSLEAAAMSAVAKLEAINRSPDPWGIWNARVIIEEGVFYHLFEKGKCKVDSTTGKHLEDMAA